VTATDAFDLLDIAPSEIGEGDRDRFAPIDIAITDETQVEDDRPEPTLTATSFFVEFDEPAQLDPNRAGLIWELPPAVVAWGMRWRAPLMSLAFHLLPAVIVLLLPLLIVEPPPPIPVQLVIEQPPPPPPPPPAPEPAKAQPKPPKMEVGRLASVDMGAVKPPELGRAADPVAQPSAGEQQPTPSDAQTAAATPPPPMPLPKPAPSPAALHPPKPSGAHVPRHDLTPHDAPISARFTGPPAARDEYFAYLVELVRRHADLLPRSLASELHGETDLSIQVQDNGTILQVGILHSSGNPELDERVVAMVKAVGRFPPLPQWFQGNVMDMVFRIGFPLQGN
jgi:periplasmic protein TonB